MPFYRSIAVAITYVLVWQLPGVYGQVEFQRCKVEVETAWAKACARAHSLQYTYQTELLDNANGDRVVTRTQTKAKRTANCVSREAVVTNSPEGNAYPKAVYKSYLDIMNSRYLTRLSREAGKAEWLHVGPLMLRDDTLDPQVSQLIPEELEKPSVNGHLSDFLQIPLAKLFAQPSFRLTKFGAAPAKPDCYRVEYKSGRSTADADGVSVGWVDLAPAKGWSVVECEGTNTSSVGTQSSHSVFSVEMIEGDCPVLAEETTKYSAPSGSATRKMTRHVTYVATVDPKVPESEFTLSFYGFPEPEGIVWKKPTPNYVWILAGAAGLMLFSLICGWLIRRRSRAKAPSLPAYPPPTEAP